MRHGIRVAVIRNRPAPVAIFVEPSTELDLFSGNFPRSVLSTETGVIDHAIDHAPHESAREEKTPESKEKRERAAETIPNPLEGHIDDDAPDDPLREREFVTEELLLTENAQGDLHL